MSHIVMDLTPAKAGAPARESNTRTLHIVNKMVCTRLTFFACVSPMLFHFLSRFIYEK